MSQNLPNMLENTITKMRQMMDVNSVIGDTITTADGVTIIPISKITVGFAGGGSDYVSKHPNKQDNPFGSGVGGGMNVTPFAFLIVKEVNVLMLPVALPANSATERIIEMVPDLLDKVADFIDNKLDKKPEGTEE